MPLNPDLDLALACLAAFPGADPDPGRVVAFIHEGEPVALERARFNRTTGHTYTPAKSRHAEEALAWVFKNAMRQRPAFRDTVAIYTHFYLPDRRGKDIDNLTKLVLDAGTKSGIWIDDKLVIRAIQGIDLDRERPRTVIAVTPCLGSLSRSPLLTATGAI